MSLGRSASARKRLVDVNWAEEIEAGHMPLATAALLAKAREKAQRFLPTRSRSENPGHVCFLYQNCCPRRRSVCFLSFRCSYFIRAVGIVVQPGRLDAFNPSV